jgi:hypothetical protein
MSIILSSEDLEKYFARIFDENNNDEYRSLKDLDVEIRKIVLNEIMNKCIEGYNHWKHIAELASRDLSIHKVVIPSFSEEQEFEIFKCKNTVETILGQLNYCLERMQDCKNNYVVVKKLLDLKK